ncbi:MAG: hypothetical protein FJY83_00335 [Candidatus Aminicenantes bacterium]|nr:hypothetical protein [Candidatus Aminicenantes bacterium]
MNEHPADRLSSAELKHWLRDAALNWLAHDGLWFRAVEEALGLEKAIALDKKAWESFTVIEAKRIMKRLSIPPGGGIPSLVRALEGRLYALINVQEVSEADERRCVFRMKACRVQEARRKQGLADFPCKEVGIVEYSGFARTIDPRIETRCLHCPPDPHPQDSYCAWEFILRD